VEDERTRGVVIRVAYDGTAFKGWASQREERTVEDTLRGAVLEMDPRASGLRGTSRTDAGVHAEGQIVAFDTSREIPPRGWVLGLNQHLPDDVSVRFARATSPGFSPRFAARSKRYRYRLLVDPVRDPTWRTRAWRLDHLDLSLMAAEARSAIGTHDFAAFRGAADQRPTTQRTLTRVDIEAESDPRIAAVVVQGDSFLYNMVRILVGTLVDVGRGRLEAGAVQRAHRSLSRSDAGTTAPAHGLVLEWVELDVPPGAGDSWPP